MDINKTLLKEVLEEMGLPSGDEVINRITSLLSSREPTAEITEEDKKQGVDDDVLMSIRLRLKNKDGSTEKAAKKISSAVV